MVCKIHNKKVVKWSIDKKHIKQIYTHMYNKVEYGGEIELNFDSKNSSSVVGHSGKPSTVIVPSAVIIWHTHHINGYFTSKRLWGWPSGADMMCSMGLALRGLSCHAVFTVEGIYTIQVNPCVVTSLLNINKIIKKEDYPNIKVSDAKWGNFLRGFVLQTIGMYFDSTFIFAQSRILVNYPHLMATDFVKFANMFTLSSVFNEKSLHIYTAAGYKLPSYDNGNLAAQSFVNYVSNYEPNTRTYEVNTKGYVHKLKLKLKYTDVLNNGGLKLLEKLSLVLGHDCGTQMKAWHTTNMFKLQLFENEVYLHNEWRDYCSLDFGEKVDFLTTKRKGNPGDIRLKADKITFDTFYDLTGNCDYIDVANHIRRYVKGGRVSKITKRKSKNSMDSIVSKGRRTSKSKV